MKTLAQHRIYPNGTLDGKVSGTTTFRGVLALLATLATLSSVIGLTSCAGYTSAAKSQPASTGFLTPSATSVSFGSLATGAISTQTVSMTNTGTAAVDVTQATISGSGFAIVGGNPTASIAVGQSKTLKVQFAPQAAGAVTGKITVTSNASNSPLTLSITATGTLGTQPSASAIPASANFGTVTMGSSNSQSITLGNIGTGTLAFSNVTVTGAGFSVTGLSTSTTMAAGSNASFSVVFAPTSQTAVQGSIVLTTNGSPSQLTIPLSGTGVAAISQLGLNPTSLGFGTVTVNSSSSLTSVLTNTGNSNVTISNVSVVGTGLSASGLAPGLILQPNQSANLTVTFAPKAAGILNAASVTVTSTASPVTIAVTGTGAQHSVSLVWGASTSSGIAGYYVYRSTTTGTGYGKLNSSSPVSPSSTQYTDSTVQSGQTYYYVVTAVNSSNVESADSNQTVATIP